MNESEPERIFRQTFMDNDGQMTYGPEEVIDDGPYVTPGIGSFVELKDGWYRLRRRTNENADAETAS